MDPASEELERRSRYLSSLIRRTKLGASPAPPPPDPEPEPVLEPELVPMGEKRGEAEAPVVEKEKREVKDVDGKGKEAVKGKEEEMAKKVSVRVRAADMPLPLQRRAIRLAHDAVAAMPRLESKRLALELKKLMLRLDIGK